MVVGEERNRRWVAGCGEWRKKGSRLEVCQWVLPLPGGQGCGRSGRSGPKPTMRDLNVSEPWFVRTVRKTGEVGSRELHKGCVDD